MDAILEVIRSEMEREGYLACRKIGEWRENQERGIYLEAVDIPKGEPRYLQVSPAYLWEVDTANLLKGLVVWLEVDREELLERI
jgi:hypothetical protein